MLFFTPHNARTAALNAYTHLHGVLVVEVPLECHLIVLELARRLHGHLLLGRTPLFFEPRLRNTTKGWVVAGW